MIKWILDSEILNSEDRDRGITFTDPGGPGKLSSILTITTSPANNVKTISCQVTSLEPFDQVFSNSSTLNIIGWFVYVVLFVVVCVCFVVSVLCKLMYRFLCLCLYCVVINRTI